MARPTLSICIPTYHRERHVEASLARIFRQQHFPFAVEVVLSDNASPDGTADVAKRYQAEGFPLRYYRMARNVGAVANILAVLRRATGTFAISLADDDEIEVSNLSDAVAWMAANPTCVATYGPVHHFDAVAKRSSHLSFALPAPVVFSPAERCAAARLIAQHRLIPEVPLFRTDVLGNVLLPCKSYWLYFELLDRLMNFGSVHFRSEPHYRILGRQWEGDEHRSTVSKHADFGIWESMYRGACHFHHAALVSGGDKLSQEERRSLDHDFVTFANELRNSAIYTLAMAGRFADAVETVKWLAGNGVLNREPAILRQLMEQSTAAAVFAVADVIDDAAEIKRILLYRFGDHAAALVRGFGVSRPEIEASAIEQASEIGDAESALILTIDDAARNELIAAGGFPGKILCLSRLAESFDMRRWLDFAARTDGARTEGE